MSIEGFAEVVAVSDNEDLWAGHAATVIQPEPVPAGFEPYLKSSDVADAAAGTGIRSVRFLYINTSFKQMISPTITMNGTTEVASGVTDVVFINEMFAMTVGSNLVSVGNVDALNGSGGAVMNRIAAAGNYALSTMRMVPDDVQCQIDGWHASGTAGTVKEATVRIRSSSYDEGGPPICNAGVYHFKDSTRIKDTHSGGLPFPQHVRIPARATVKISAWATGSITIAAGWRGHFVPPP